MCIEASAGKCLWKRPVTSAALFALALPVLASADSRVFRFHHTHSETNMREVAALVRSITNAKSVHVDIGEHSFTLSARPDQIALAEWLFDHLDNPLDSTPKQYRIPDREDSVDNSVRLFRIAHVQRVQELNDLGTLVLALEEIRFAFTYGAQNVLALRGTPEQMRGAEWLVHELDRPADAFAADPGTREYTSDGDPDFVIRVFYVPQVPGLPEFQELATLVRSGANIRWMFTLISAKAIAVRAARDQVALAAWLIRNITTEKDGAQEYALTEPDSKVRMFHLRRPHTPDELMRLALRVRAATGSLYVLPLPSWNVFGIRGTVQQIAVAERIITGSGE